jgi:hypothetical protein
MELGKRVFVAVFLLSLICLIRARPSHSDSSSGLSLDVYLKSFSTNVSVVTLNATEPGFGVGSEGYTVDQSVTFSTIYLQVSPAMMTVKGDDGVDGALSAAYLVIRSFTMHSSPSGNCLPFLLLRGQRVTFPLSIGVGIGNSIGLELHYNCSKVQEANLTFAIDLLQGPQITFGWAKATPSNRLGFSIGTFIFLPDVAYDGKVLSDWAPTSHHVQVSAGVLSTPFNFWMSLVGESQVISKVQVTSTPEYCHPYFQGEPDVVIQRPSLALIVYNCSQNGTTLITMQIELEGGFDPLVVEWTKQSGGYREFFLVGTQPGASDVIWWGLTLPLWSDYHFIMHPTILSSTFYFVMNDPGDTQQIGQPILSYNAEVANVQLSGDLIDGGVTNNIAKSLTITYNCLVQGQTFISIQIPIPGYENAIWKWTKQCGTPRHDFQIGTQPKIDDVVSAGVATFLYSPTLHTAFVFPDKSSSNFYMHLSLDTNGPSNQPSSSSSSSSSSNNNGNAISTEVAPSTSPSAPETVSISVIRVNTTRPSCTPFITGNVTAGTTLTLSTILEMTLTYNCTRPGNTNVSVYIVLEGPYTPITFTWIKRVGKGRNALKIGTIKNFDDVVSGGVPTPLYDPSTFTAFYGAYQLQATFYAQLTNSYSTQTIKSIRANASTLFCAPHVYGSFLTSDNSGVLTNSPQAFNVSWNCFIGGKATVMVTFDLQDWGALVVAMTVYSGGPRSYLDIGTMKGASDVVLGGLPTPLWIPGALNGATVSGNVLTTTFWLGMQSPNQYQTMSPPFLTLQSQEPIISPYINGSFVNGGTLTDGFDQMITVVYNCSSLGTVPISIGFLLPPYDSITFSWTKICSAQRMGFTVGTTKGNNDVVEDGYPAMAWNPLTHVAFVIGTELQTTFWVGELLHSGSQLITSVLVNSSLPICSPYILGDIDNGTMLQEGQFMSFTVVYNCSNIGNTNIQVTISLTGNYMPASFMWTKRVRGVFYEMDVGTSKTSSDVIYQGSPTFAYDPFSHTHLSGDTESEFWVSTTTIPRPMDELILLPSVAFSLSPWLLPDVAGPLSATVSMKNNSQTSFSVIPHCLLSSELLDNYASLFVAVTPVPFSPAIFSYFIDCPPNVLGLTVGFDDQFDQVVNDGVPTPSWSPANTSRIEIEADFNILRFWVSAESLIPLQSILIAEDGIIITEPLGASNHADKIEHKKIMMERFGYPAFPKPACRAILSGSLWESMSVNNTIQLLQLELNCTIGGTNNVSVILVPNDPSVSSTVWTFSKTMGGFRHGFDISAQASDFSANTHLKAVVDGEPTISWEPGASPFPNATQLSLSSSASFSLQLSNVYFGRDPLQEFSPPSINVSQPGICAPILFGNASLGGFLTRDAPRKLDVLTNCYGNTFGRPIVFEISISIPPFMTAVYAWKRESYGVPTYLNVDAQLSATEKTRVQLVRHGVSTPSFSWTDKGFSLWIYLDRSGLPEPIVASSNTTLTLLAPMVNTTTSNCAFIVSGNATDGNTLSLATGAPLLLIVQTSSCNATNIDFTVTLTASPFTTPVIVQISKVPAPPGRNKFPVALFGIIIGSTVFIIAAVSIGLYLCLRKPATVPSTGAYHLKRREKERKQEQAGLLANSDMDAMIN